MLGLEDEGPFLIEGVGGPIIDVALGKIPALGYHRWPNYESIVIVFLLDDGSLSYLMVDPWLRYDNVFYSWGSVPFAEDIVSLTYELDGEGIGENTIFAIDQRQRRYDVRLLYEFHPLQHAEWVKLVESDPRYAAFLQLAPGDTAYLLFAYEEGDIYDGDYRVSASELYSGSYVFYIAEDPAAPYRAGTIVFDLDLAWAEGWDPPSGRSAINGAYFVSIGEFGELLLWPAAGDALILKGGEGLEEYSFVPNWWGEVLPWPNQFSDPEFRVRYLMEHVVDFGASIDLGMTVLITGNVTWIDDVGLCYDVVLGTDHEGHFVQEIFYTVSPSGGVFIYDPVFDRWREAAFG